MKNQIIAKLYSSKEVEYVMNNIPPKHRDDLKHYAFEELLKLDNLKIKKINVGNGLLNYFKRIIWVNWKYAKNLKVKKGYWVEWKGVETIQNLFDENKVLNLIDDVDEMSDCDKILNLIDDRKYMRSVLDRFVNFNNNSVNYFFNRVVFELYYFDDMTLTEIAKETDIGYESIRKSVKFTLEYVKQQILNEIKNN